MECVIQKVMFDETFGPDEGSDDNYSSQDEIESDSESFGLYLEIKTSRGFIWLGKKSRIFKIPEKPSS